MKIARTNEKSDPQIMAWDTEFWGVRVGRATHLDGLTEWALENTVGLTCLLVGTIAEVQQAEELGYRLMDVRVTLTRKTAMLISVGRRATHDDREALIEIARSAYTQTRFYNDPELPNTACGALYGEWTRSLCDGGADMVLVIDRDGEPGGYVTVNVDNDLSEIGLIAVREDLRGTSVGTALVRAAVDYARSCDAREMQIITQGANIGALRTFEGCGFRVSDVSYWLHRWTT